MTTWATDAILRYALVRSLTHMLAQRLDMEDGTYDPEFVRLMSNMIFARIEDLYAIGAADEVQEVLMAVRAE